MKITIKYKSKSKRDKNGAKLLRRIAVFKDGVEIGTEDDHWTVEGRYHSIICDDSCEPVAFCENCFIKAMEYAINKKVEQEAFLRSYPYMDPNLFKQTEKSTKITLKYDKTKGYRYEDNIVSMITVLKDGVKVVIAECGYYFTVKGKYYHSDGLGSSIVVAISESDFIKVVEGSFNKDQELVRRPINIVRHNTQYGK